MLIEGIMEKKGIRRIEVFYKKYHMGTLFDKDEQGLYTYCSDLEGEDKVVKKYFFLPKDYEIEMLGSENKKAEGFSFVSTICSRLTRPDLIKMLQITPEDNDFDMLYKLASQGEFVGENFAFETEMSREREGTCQPMI